MAAPWCVVTIECGGSEFDAPTDAGDGVKVKYTASGIGALENALQGAISGLDGAGWVGTLLLMLGTLTVECSDGLPYLTSDPSLQKAEREFVAAAHKLTLAYEKYRAKYEKKETNA